MRPTNLSDAIFRIAIGYIFIHLHVNIGLLDILPNWLGYYFILYAIPELGKEEESTNLLIPLGQILIAVSMAEWGNALIFGGQLPLDFLDIFYSVISIYFNFQLFTNLANIAKKYECKDMGSLLVIRTIDVLLTTFMMIVGVFQHMEFVEYVVWAIGFVWVIVTIAKLCTLFSLKKELNRTVVLESEG